MSVLGENNFGIVDYIVVLGTLLGSLFIGVYFALKTKTTEDMLVGGRNMGVLPVAISMMVTYFSAISILGFPSEIFYHGIEIYMLTIVTIVCAPLSAFIFVPIFFDMKLTSVFTYIELRFNSLITRWLASLLFIIQILFITGIVLYAPSIAMETILGVPRWLSIIGMGICCTIYTSLGGFQAVIWTDVFQLVMILIGMIAIVVKGFVTAGGIGAAFTIAGEHGRLNLFNWTADPFMRHNTLNFIFGYGFTSICMMGAHQPQVQRYSSLPSKAIAIKAILMSVPINVFAATLVLLTGVSIFAAYADCDPFKANHILQPDQIVPYFVVKELAFIPGMFGLFISCIFSAVLSTVSSSLNSLAAVTWEDFCIKLKFCQNMKPNIQGHASRVIGGVYGIIIIILAFLVQNLGNLLPMVFTAIGATTGPLAAVFLMGLFLPFVNKCGAIAGTLAGMCSMFFVTFKAFQNKRIYTTLPTSIDGCQSEFEMNLANMTASVGHGNSTTAEMSEIDWPDKMFSLSYLLYPTVGAIITIIVGLLVSAVTGGFCKTKDVNPKYLHKILRKCPCISTIKELELKASVNRRNSFDRGSKVSSPYSSPYSATNSYTYYPYNYEMLPNGGNGMTTEKFIEEKLKI